MKTTVTTVGVLVALAFSVAAVVKPVDVTVQPASPSPIQVNVPKLDVPSVTVAPANVTVESPANLGALSSPEIYNPVVFYSGTTYSSTFATTSTGAGTLTAGSLIDKTSILSTNAGALTLTLPASSTLRSFVPKAGDTVSMIVVNQGTALLTLAGGTGTLLQTASSTKTVNIGGTALLTFVRKTNTDIVAHMVPGI